MQCPHCGRRQREGPTCRYCGQLLNPKNGKETKEKRKREITLLAIFLAVVIVSLFHFFYYETDDADTLINASEKEIERGKSLLQSVEQGLLALNQVQFETTSYSSEKEYASQSQEKVEALLPGVDEALTSFEKAEEFLEKAQTLRLPGDYYKRIGLEMRRVEKYTDYAETLREMGTSLLLYYGCAVNYLSGEEQVLNLMADLDRGNDNLEGKDYQFAVTSYESALVHLEEARNYYLAAFNLIGLSYASDLLSNLDYMEGALDNLSEAAKKLQLENTDYANMLAAQGIEEMALMKPLAGAQLRSEIDTWYSTRITALIMKIAEIKAEIEELEVMTC